MNVYIPFPEKERSKHKFMFRGARKWNQLPDGPKDITNIKTLKNHLKKFLKAGEKI